MKMSQPWDDTFSLLAGVKLPPTAKPGEKFEAYESDENEKRFQNFFRVQTAWMLTVLQTLKF
jgi:hypothetical protein